MSMFRALNVEPEEIVEDEIDDTKEIQIEEAFKVYQNALKLHSQGPDYYTAAAEAYHELFDSEIFKYPEVLSDFAHEQIEDTIVVGLPSIEEEVPIITANTADSAANSLPQLVYLAYKSRSQFVLDVARHNLKTELVTDQDRRQYYHSYCLRSFDDSAKALERDDTDLDLWKKAARIADTLSSQRLARFCLESVLAGDDQGVEEETVDLSGLDEAFASGELKKVLAIVQDDLALSMPDTVEPKPDLMNLLYQSNDPYPFLPERSAKLEYLNENQKPFAINLDQCTISLNDNSMQSFGASILDALMNYNNGISGIGSAGIVKVRLAKDVEDENSDSAMVDAESSLKAEICTSLSPAKISGQDLKDSSADSPRSPASFHSAHDEMHQDDEPKIDEPLADSAAADTDKHEGENAAEEKPSAESPSEVRLPTRKRSSTAAALDEPESRTKSKRLRARESLLELAAQEEEVGQDHQQYNEEQLRILEDADETAITYLNMLLRKAKVTQFGSLGDIRKIFWNDELARPNTPISAAHIGTELHLTDMRRAFIDWSDDRSAAIMAGNNARESTEASSGLNLFLRHLKSTTSEIATDAAEEQDVHTLGILVETINRSSATLFEAITMWLLALFSSRKASGNHVSAYLGSTWSTEFKALVLNIALMANEQIEAYFSNLLNHYKIEQNDLPPSLLAGNQPDAMSVIELVQSLFEMHLDAFATTTTSTEGEDYEDMKLQQRIRLEHWAQLSEDYVQICLPSIEDADTSRSLTLRFVWASIKYAIQKAGSDKSHVLLCLQDFKAMLQTFSSPSIMLPNNSTVPQISIAAVEQEISRLSTLDFFMGVFDDEKSDALDVIVKLEPILENTSVNSHDDIETGSPGTCARIDELRSFLNSGDASLRLFLWRKLQNAYAQVSYIPKVISCLLRSFEVISNELHTERHYSLQPKERQLAMFRWIRDGDELLLNMVNRISEDSQAFEFIDEEHFASSMAALVTMLKLLHGFVLYDDAVRVGRVPSPTLRPSSAKLFEKSRDRFRDSYVRLWTVLFYFFKEATVQFPGQFERPADELAEYLRNVHNALGYRQYCKQCNKGFVKLVKNQLLTLQSDIDYSQDIAQILYDMYQLKFSPGTGDADHGCIPELLRDKTTAMSLVPLIMTYARRFSPKDLIKSDLKITIDKIQTCLGQMKTSPSLSHNKKAMSAYLRSAIDPQQVYGAMRGLGDFTFKPVQGDYANVAATGWYMLLGQMSLAKFKSIKRVNPTGTDDLETASTFLRHDLEHNMNNWLGWYRLAQVFDAKIEDSLIWNSTKLNESRAEIITLERSAINAYTMSIAVAMRVADDTPDSIQLLSDMFFDLAVRLYASSRPPLNMEAFSTDRHLRHLSSNLDRSMSKAPFVLPFKSYTLWRFAAALIRKRFRTCSKEWLCQYTLGKCLWKMFQSAENSEVKSPVTIEDVLEALSDAVEAVPKKEKSSDYILEPHYKIVSVVHKLVHRKLLDPHKAVEYLRVTSFSADAQLGDDEQGTPEWEPYMLDILKKLGHADKSNWHHRITARAAHVIYDDEPDVAGALGAKHQFTQQIFTKTMTMQVWKPEFERPGRHYVYTGRYLTFFVHLLDQLNDRANMEQLVRRIRRKTTDFLDHTKIWELTALTYVKMLRRYGKVPDGKERALFDKIAHEDFVKISEKLEKWTHETGTTSAYLDIIHDAIELKKLNNSLMKGSAIDDLVGDSYACLYESFVSQLTPEEVELPKPILPQGTFINMTTEAAPTGDDRVDRMRLNNLLSAQVDGGTSGLSSAISTPAGIDIQTTPRATPPVDTVRVPTPTKPGRVKTITKREVQRKAEAALNRQAIAKTPTLGRKPFIEIPGKPGDDLGSRQAPDNDDENENKEDQADESRVASLRPSHAGSEAPSEEHGDEHSGNERAGEVDSESELSEAEDRRPGGQAAFTSGRLIGVGTKAEEDDEEPEGEPGESENDNENDNDDEEAQDGDEEDNDEEDLEEDENADESGAIIGGGDDGEKSEAEDEIAPNLEERKNDQDAMEVDKNETTIEVEIPDSQEPKTPGHDRKLRGSRFRR